MHRRLLLSISVMIFLEVFLCFLVQKNGAVQRYSVFNTPVETSKRFNSSTGIHTSRWLGYFTVRNICKFLRSTLDFGEVIAGYFFEWLDLVVSRNSEIQLLENPGLLFIHRRNILSREDLRHTCCLSWNFEWDIISHY